MTAAEAIQKDLSRLTQTVEDFKKASGERGFSPPLAQTLLLSQFYTGLESCFEKTLRLMSIPLPPKSEDHHRKLLDLAIASKIVPENCVVFLDDLRSFRHLGRHAYGMEFRGNEIMEKAVLAGRLWPELRASIKSLLPLPPDAGSLKDAVAINQATGEIKPKSDTEPLPSPLKSALKNDPALQVRPPKDPELP